MTPKYPDVVVQLSGEDGNAFAILRAVDKAMEKAGIDKDERNAFFIEATDGNYDHLLQTCIKWVDVE